MLKYLYLKFCHKSAYLQSLKILMMANTCWHNYSLVTVCECWFPAFWEHLQFQTVLRGTGNTDHHTDCGRMYHLLLAWNLPFLCVKSADQTIQKRFSKTFSLYIVSPSSSAVTCCWLEMLVHTQRDLLRNEWHQVTNWCVLSCTGKGNWDYVKISTYNPRF